MILEGRVVRSQSRQFTVETNRGPVKAVVLKGLRTCHRDLVDPVAVGDHVKVRLGAGVDGTIEEVHPRRNKLSRPVVGLGAREQLIAANLGGALIVQAVSPPWKTATFDRYLVMASAGGVPAALCLNKIELDPGEDSRHELEVYRGIGYPVFTVSARERQGLDPLRAFLSVGPTVLIGPSGVGKSSLVNAISPGTTLRTGELSGATGKGRHTTSWVELVAMAGGIEVVDSPGLRVLGLWGVAPADLERHFPEFRALEGSCRFSGCSHLNEPNCRVLLAVAEGRIAGFRYDSYVRIRETLAAGGEGDRSGRSRSALGRTASHATRSRRG